MNFGASEFWAAISLSAISGLIGFGSALATQIVNSRRERHRDDIRWNREIERFLVELENDRKMAWREKRLEIYSKFLDPVGRFVSYIEWDFGS